MSEQLRHKMLSWEATPPEGAWEGLSRQLQESCAEQQLALKLEKAAVDPPSGNWDKIAMALPSASQPAPVFSIRPIGSKIARYGAAAAVAGFLLWNFLSRNSPAPVSPPPSLSGMTSAPVVTATPPPAGVQATQNEEPQKNETYAEQLATTLPVKRKLRHALLHPSIEAITQELPKPEMPAYLKPSDPSQLELPVQQRDPRYILVPAQNGLMHKLSAKFAAVVYRSEAKDPQDSENLSHPLLKSLESKMLNNIYVPDPANLFDLVMFSQFLQEEQ